MLKNFLLRGIIGLNESERRNAQDILINIELYTDLSLAAKSDRVEDSIDYHALSNKVIAHVEKPQPYTVEVLAGDIAVLCLEENGARFALCLVNYLASVD